MVIHLFIASFSPAQGERNEMVNTKFTRPVNEMPMSSDQWNSHAFKKISNWITRNALFGVPSFRRADQNIFQSNWLMEFLADRFITVIEKIDQGIAHFLR